MLFNMKRVADNKKRRVEAKNVNDFLLYISDVFFRIATAHGTQLLNM